MAEQRTEVGPAYYDGWQKQVADLRAENSRLAAEVERMRGVLEAVEWYARCGEAVWRVLDCEDDPADGGEARE